MFEVGFTELLLIFALALLVLGPQKLPKLAQQVGRWVGRARAMARQFRDQLEEEAHSLESKMNVDPGIDTSLQPQRPTPGTTPPAGTPTPPGAAPAPPYAPEVEEDFYPPDHHMHPKNRAAAEAASAQATSAATAEPTAAPAVEPAAAAAADAPASITAADETAPANTQGELDLTTAGDRPKTH